MKSVDEYGRTAFHFVSILGNTKILAMLSKKFKSEEHIYIRPNRGNRVTLRRAI